jgi:hypothetical protein
MLKQRFFSGGEEQQKERVEWQEEWKSFTFLWNFHRMLNEVAEKM